MTPDEITVRVHCWVRKNTKAPKGDLAPDADLRADYKADDVDLIQLTMDIEDDLCIDIDDAEAEGLKTVGDCVRLARAKRGGLA